MELTVEGQPQFGIEGPVTVELPSFMMLLPDSELKIALCAIERCNLVVAAGRHSSGDIVMLTGGGELREIKAGSHGIPTGPVVPTDHGLTFVVGDGFEVASKWAIENANILISFGALETSEGLRVSYVDYREDETDAGTTPQADP